MMSKSRFQIDLDSEQYYTAPLGNKQAHGSETLLKSASLFEVKTELARLALNVEEFAKRHADVLSEIKTREVEAEKRGIELKEAQSDISERVTRLSELLVRKLAGLVPEISRGIVDSETEIRAELKSEIERIGRKLSGLGSLAGDGVPGVDFVEQLDRIESTLAGQNRLGGEERVRSTIAEMLTVQDSFDRLMTFIEEQGKLKEESWVVGIRSIHDLLKTQLARLGLKRIEELDVFDPKIHRALATDSNPDLPEGAVLKVLQHGYLFKGKVFRSSEVVVNRLKGS